jgi:hypothetical protein
MAQQGGGNNGGDGRGRVVDPETDLRVGNKTGQMGKSFKDNPELASAAGEKGGLHRRAGEEVDPKTEKQVNERIEKASAQGGSGSGGSDGGGSSGKDDRTIGQIAQQKAQEIEDEGEHFDENDPNYDQEIPTFRAKPAQQQGGGQQQDEKIPQKAAVFNAIVAVTGKEQFEEALKLEGDQKRKVRDHVFQQFKEGKVTYGGEMPEDKELRRYCTGLVSNWLRKDRRLNGNTTYAPQNPGQRAGQGDEQLQMLKQLAKLPHLNDDQRREVQAAIEQREEQLRGPQVQIDPEKLPENLRHLVPH